MKKERRHPFRLRFPSRQIQVLAQRYRYAQDRLVGEKIGPRTRERGYFTRNDFLKLCRWKTSRSQKRCANNSQNVIRETTRIALSNPCERVRISILTILEGVSWPTASVLLHFGYDNLYPILDYRALWSLGVNKPPLYCFDFWWAYTKYCRRLAHRCGVSMRVLDRALWQHSKENQPRE
jgi:hypothetical protein